MSSLGFIQLGSAAGAVINLGSPGVAELLPDVGSRLGLDDLDEGEDGQR